MSKYLNHPTFIFLLIVTLVVAGECHGQKDVEVATEQKTSDSNPDALDEIDEATIKKYSAEIEFTTMVMQRTFSKIDLTEDQQTKIFKLIDDNVPYLVVTDKAAQAALTPEQTEAWKKHFKSARSAGIKFEQAQQSALRSLKLPAEQQKKYLAAKAASSFQKTKLNNLIASELTPLQRKTLPMFGGAEQYINVYLALRLPGMTSDDDAKFVQSTLEAVKGVSGVECNLEENMVKFYSGYRKKLLKALGQQKDDPRFEGLSLFKVRRLPKETLLPVDWLGEMTKSEKEKPAVSSDGK